MNTNEKVMQIGNRKIGINFPPFVIAEIGINHEGSLKTAFEMVDAAHEAGAEVIKHQTHVVADEMSDEAKNIIPGNTDVSIYEVMERCALSEEEEISLKAYVESKNMIFLSTPFSRAAADRLEKMNVLAYKIGSGEMNNYPLLKHIASFGKPMIVSTGMNNIKSVKNAVAILEDYNIEYALLHTTNLYPTPPELVRLGAMQQLSNDLDNPIIGLSDHTLNNNACLAAVALGASVLERHFTDKKERTGPDIVCSMDPTELNALIQGSKEIFKMRGGEKEPAKEEKVTSDFAFATVVTIRDIKAGEKFDKTNIWVKRPGNGEIKAQDYEKVLGGKSKRNITKNNHIFWADIE